MVVTPTTFPEAVAAAPLYKEGEGGGDADGEGETGGLMGESSADEKFSNCHETRLVDSMAD